MGGARFGYNATMALNAPIGSVDLVTGEAVKALAAVGHGPWASLLMPTHRAGNETRQDPIRLGNLVADAGRQLVAAGQSQAAADELLAPAQALVDGDAFWPHQADGLAVYCWGGAAAHFRVPLALTEEATVAAAPRVRPLLPLLVGDGHFFILALSQNEIRLFEATRSTVGQLDLGLVPRSMDEALAHEDPERQLQFRSGGGGGGEAQFHGHGAGDEVDKAAVERFLRAVDHGLADCLDASTHPLVLAGVGYYGPIFRSVSRHPNIVEAMVEGNPDHARPEQLQAAAWELVAPQFSAGAQHAADRLAAAVGTGDTLADPVEVVVAAREGRVDTLFVGDTPPVWGRVGAEPRDVEAVDGPSLEAEDLLDRAVLATLSTGGSLVRAEEIDAGHEGASPVAALLRY